MKEKAELSILAAMVILIALAAGCGGYTETSMSTTTTVIPAPVCAVANNQICSGGSAVFYDSNLNADINYYGAGAEYVYIIDNTDYAANGSIDTFETGPLPPGVYYATLEIVQFDQHGDAVIEAAANCPPVEAYNCD